MSQYSELLKDPRWQKKRLEILERDQWTCQLCFDSESTLIVHHRKYLKDTDPWEYPSNLLITLCESCHKSETEERDKCESMLLDSLRQTFFSNNLLQLAQGFYKLELQHIPDIVASAYTFALTDSTMQRYILDKYWDYEIKQCQLKGKSNAKRR